MSRDEGSQLGKYAATLQVANLKGKQPDDSTHHLGDDTGKAITSAYRADGAGAAADIIEAYLEAFNMIRRDNGLSELTAAAAVKNLGFAFSPRGLTEREQDEVAAEFRRRR